VCEFDDSTLRWLLDMLRKPITRGRPRECQMPSDPTAVAEQPTTGTASGGQPEEDLMEEVLVEEVSIDGMCGVY
jgi:mycofactocin precursor